MKRKQIKKYEDLKKLTLNNLIGVTTKDKKYFYKVKQEWDKLDYSLKIQLQEKQKIEHSINVAKLLTILINKERLRLTDKELRFYIKCALLHDIKKGEENHDYKAGEFIKENIKCKIDTKKYEIIINSILNHSDKLYTHTNNKLGRLIIEADLLAKLILPCCIMRKNKEWSNNESIKYHIDIVGKYYSDHFPKESLVLQNSKLISRSAKEIYTKNNIYIISCKYIKKLL